LFSISNFSEATLNFSFIDLIFLISFQGFILKDSIIFILFSFKNSFNKIKKLHFLSTEYGTKITASYFLAKSRVCFFIKSKTFLQYSKSPVLAICINFEILVLGYQKPKL
jgi:hypothetical protein